MPAPVAVSAVETVPLGVAAATAVLPACVAAKAAPPATRLPATTIAASHRFIGILIFVFIVLSFPLIACLYSIRLSTSACSFVCPSVGHVVRPARRSPAGRSGEDAAPFPCAVGGRARRARSVGRALLARPSSLSSPQRVRAGTPEQGEPVQAQRVDAGIHLAHFSFGVWYLEGSPPIHRSSVHPQRRRVP